MRIALKLVLLISLVGCSSLSTLTLNPELEEKVNLTRANYLDVDIHLSEALTLRRQETGQDWSIEAGKVVEGSHMNLSEITISHKAVGKIREKTGDEYLVMFDAEMPGTGLRFKYDSLNQRYQLKADTLLQGYPVIRYDDVNYLGLKGNDTIYLQVASGIGENNRVNRNKIN